ncbi:hypothetical protein BU23DRAFT_586213 [Bimuria novae-zelandiae CBS 107.79]|uniref:Zn(2)-C6 fungal-type domain-containing protein n=1 Tax=Bimuria novae-zelandiae CBS 107.79 TaxID=1447943 RepID=A0A6A5VQI1_9PLEO|nr:hypothetical protein BU23DRAFT_586213 [Bimuria novae-zelandiae CBS 107.79]
MASEIPTPSDHTESPIGSTGNPDQPTAEERAAKNAEEKEKAIKRRAHRKSRFGCKNCKVRRIKCDERKPECTNCRTRQVRCDYLPTVTSSTSSQTTATASPAETSVPSSPFPALNANDIELMYHWTTTTANTLSSQTPGVIFWRTQVTEIALQHHHVLHLILAITAHHLARFRLERHDQFLGLANHHYATALPTVTAELSQLNPDNCDAVLISVELIAFIKWAKGPQPGEYLAFGEKGQSDFLVMFRGIRTTIETLGYENFTKSHAPNIRKRMKPLPNVAGTLDYEKPLAELCDYIQYSSSPETLECNTRSYDVLLEMYKNRYGGVDGEYHVSFGWIYRMKEEFLAALQRHDSVPLVIYAHFAVLMNDMERFWYMQGWTTHVLAGIWEILRDEDRVHMRWPINVVGWIPPHY